MIVLKIKGESKWIERGFNPKDKTHNITCPICGAGFKFRGHARSQKTCEKFKFCPTCGTKLVDETKEKLLTLY